MCSFFLMLYIVHIIHVWPPSNSVYIILSQFILIFIICVELVSLAQYFAFSFKMYVLCCMSGVTETLLEHKALVKEKNPLGWTPFDEALSYGNRDTSKYYILLLSVSKKKLGVRYLKDLEALPRPP